MVPKEVFNIIAIAFIGIIMIACEDTYQADEYDPPDEVSNIEIINTDTKVILSWNDPADSIFDYVEITYLSEVIEVESGVETFEIAGLINDSSYYFTLRTVNILGDKSVGMKATGRPKVPPVIQWTGTVNAFLDYSNQGYPSGTIKVMRTCINTGELGYALAYASIIDNTTQDTISYISNNLLLEPDVDYTFYFEANSDITIFNCTTCDADSTSVRVEFNVLYCDEPFEYEPVCCLDIQVCPNGNDQMAIQWNSISARSILMIKD